MLQLGMTTHIVGLIGYTYLNEAPVLVSEYCAKGDLLSVIRDSLADYKDCVRAVTALSSGDMMYNLDHGRIAGEALLQHRPLANGPRIFLVADQ